MKVIVCERCKKLCKTVNKSLCHKCYQFQRHLRSPLKKCECSEDCKEMIHSVQKNGLKAKYKFGHFSKGINSPNFKGGRLYNRGGGYIMLLAPNHPFHDSLGYVREHRLVYEQYYNCILLPYADIHHKNKIKTDNRIENLQPMYRKLHQYIHRKGIKLIDHSNTVCLLCNSKTTSLNNKGYPMWNKYENGYICDKCYKKEYSKGYRRRKVLENE